MKIMVSVLILDMVFHLMYISRTFSLLNGGFLKNVVILGADMSSSVHVDNLIFESNQIWFLDKGLTHRLDNTALNAKAEYYINFTKQGNKFCLVYIATELTSIC